MRRSAAFLIVGVVACCEVQPEGLAQERQIGGLGLTVFADRNFRGRSATLRADTPNLQAIGLNDAVSSLRVGAGERWEVCEHANYMGRCVVVSGSEPDLRRSGWNDTISSARRLSGGRGGVTPPVQPGGRLELFSSTRFGGNRRAFNGAQSDLRRVGFNDAARSLRIGRGETWEVCVDAEFVDCRVVNTDIEDLNRLGMSRRISSVRPWRDWGGGRGGSFAIVLYDDRNFRGRSHRVERAAPVLSGFGNRAESVQVNGGSWELCDRTAFAGRCVVVSQNVNDLSTLGLRNRVASVRPVPAPR